MYFFKYLSNGGISVRRKANKQLSKRWTIYLIFPAILIIVTVGTYIFWDNNENLLANNSNNNEKVQNTELTTSIEADKDTEDIKSEESNEIVQEEEVVEQKDEIEENKVDDLEYQYDSKEIEGRIKSGNFNNNGNKMVFLTFDDGTSNTVTPRVLDILDEENVKATFFVVGKIIEDGGEEAKNLLKREYNSGHAIGNHSYSHNYSSLYPGRTLNLNNFVSDYNKNNEVLKSILGDDFNTRVWRCPGGYMSWNGMSELDQYAMNNNISYIDWNALNGDAEGKPKTADELYNNTVTYSSGKDIVVVLMHDTYGKEQTVEALQRIIQYYKDNGYAFKTLV